MVTHTTSSGDFQYTSERQEQQNSRQVKEFSGYFHPDNLNEMSNGTNPEIYGQQTIANSYFSKPLMHVKDTAFMNFDPFTVIERQGREEMVANRFLNLHLLYAAGGEFIFKDVQL